MLRDPRLPHPPRLLPLALTALLPHPPPACSLNRHTRSYLWASVLASSSGGTSCLAPGSLKPCSLVPPAPQISKPFWCILSAVLTTLKRCTSVDLFCLPTIGWKLLRGRDGVSFFFLFFFDVVLVFLPMPHSIQDLSSLTRDRTHALCSKKLRVLPTGPQGKS